MSTSPKIHPLPVSKDIRLLAAIMFTDIVGYTALMQENENNAKAIRDKHRNNPDSDIIPQLPYRR
jgi:hypothetical protein